MAYIVPSHLADQELAKTEAGHRMVRKVVTQLSWGRLQYALRILEKSSEKVTSRLAGRNWQKWKQGPRPGATGCVWR